MRRRVAITSHRAILGFCRPGAEAIAAIADARTVDVAPTLAACPVPNPRRRARDACLPVSCGQERQA